MKRYQALQTCEFTTGAVLEMTMGQARLRAHAIEGGAPEKKRKDKTWGEFTLSGPAMFKAGELFGYGGGLSRRAADKMIEVDENGDPVEPEADGSGSDGGGDGGGDEAQVLALPDGSSFSQEGPDEILIDLPPGTSALTLPGDDAGEVALPVGTLALVLIGGVVSLLTGEVVALPEGMTLALADGTPVEVANV